MTRGPGKLLRRWGPVSVAMLVLLLGALGVVEGPWGLTRPQGIALATMLAAVVLWSSEAVPLFVTSVLVGLLGAGWLAPRLGEAPSRFLAPFASDVILLFLGGFVLSAALHRHGIDERLARRVLARTGSEPRRVVVAVALTTAGLSMWMSNTASTAMMLALAAALLTQVPTDDPLRRGMILAVAVGANLGGLATPVGTPPNAVAIASLERAGIAAPAFAVWMMLALPVLAITLYASMWVLLRWYPPGVDTVALPEAEVRPWSVAGASTAGLALLTVLLWLTTGLHPLSLGLVGLVPVVLAFGSGLLPSDELRRLPWDVLLVVGGGLALGEVIMASGLDGWILAGLPTQGAGMLVTLLIFGLLAAVLSAIMSNTAAANLVLPLALAAPGAPGLPTALVVAYACSVSMVLPVSTPPNAMVFASGELKASELIRLGLVVTVVGLSATLLVGLPWWWLWGFVE